MNFSTHSARLTLDPIGLVYSPLKSKAETARQPAAATDATVRIELYPDRHFEHALEHMEGWERVSVPFRLHLNASWRPKVLPPRSASGRKGVFATRSPYRPNPLGLSAVHLERIEGLTLHIREVDLVDGTATCTTRCSRADWTTRCGPDAPPPSATRCWSMPSAGTSVRAASWIRCARCPGYSRG